MQLKNLGPAIRRAFSAPKSLTEIIHKDRDAAMASYVLEHHAGRIEAAELGHALIWAVNEAGKNEKKWLATIQLLRAHNAAADICPSVIASCLYESATDKTVHIAAELLKFPQINAFAASGWDGILFACLPKDDPEKRRIEKRNFDDKDGHPEILKMVRAAMNKTPPPPPPSVTQP